MICNYDKNNSVIRLYQFLEAPLISKEKISIAASRNNWCLPFGDTSQHKHPYIFLEKQRQNDTYEKLTNCKWKTPILHRFVLINYSTLTERLYSMRQKKNVILTTNTSVIELIK